MSSSGALIKSRLQGVPGLRYTTPEFKPAWMVHQLAPQDARRSQLFAWYYSSLWDVVKSSSSWLLWASCKALGKLSLWMPPPRHLLRASRPNTACQSITCQTIGLCSFHVMPWKNVISWKNVERYICIVLVIWNPLCYETPCLLKPLVVWNPKQTKQNPPKQTNLTKPNKTPGASSSKTHGAS